MKNIAPDWKATIGGFPMPYDVGKYTLKIFNLKDQSLVSVGSFKLLRT